MLISLEQEVKAYFQRHGIPFVDGSNSFKRLDFGFGDKAARRHFRFDVKEKRQPYNMDHWQNVAVPQEHLFILDDLAARKLLAYAPNSGLVVRDNTRQVYFLFTVVDLYLMPRQRVNRPIRNRVDAHKGKWLIDLRNGHMCGELTDVFARIDDYLSHREEIFFKGLACYGDFAGEEIPEQGITRQPRHWQTDINATR